MPLANLLLPALLAFVTTVALHWLALYTFPRVGLVDFPGRYGLARPPIPYPTGCLVVAVFLIFLFTIVPFNKQSLGIALGVLLLAVVTFIDDRRRLPATVRLAAQLMVGLIVFGLGTRIYTITNPLLADGIIKLDTHVIVSTLFSNPPLLSGVFTMVWLGLTMNALNWFDGIPGQVSVLSVIGFTTIGLLAVSPRITHLDPDAQLQLASLAFVLAGISAAAALFDRPPARVLMGDTGAMFFGLLLGILTIYAGGKVATAFLVLGVPLIDSMIVAVRRMLRGQSPLAGNTPGERMHLHHRLLARGWSPRQVIALTALLGTGFGGSALFLSTRGKFAAAVLLFVVMLWLSWYSGRNRSPNSTCTT